MLGVNGNSMVIMFATLNNICPSSFLLLKIETSGIGEEDSGDNHTSKTEPWYDVKLLLDGNVIVKDGGGKSTKLSAGGRETVGCSANWGGINLGSNKEGNSVGTELIEERRQEVHGLERVDVRRLDVVVVMESGYDEKNEVEQETDLLHILSAVKFVVD